MAESEDGLMRRKEKKEKKDKKDKKEKKKKKKRKRDEESDDDDVVDFAKLDDVGSGAEDDETSDEGREMAHEAEDDSSDGVADHMVTNTNDKIVAGIAAKYGGRASVGDDRSLSHISDYAGQEPEYDDEQEDAEVGDFMDEMDEPDQAMHGRYPTIADPKLFMVRVNGGFARTLCAQIMYKCLTRAARGQDMMIKSAFCRDHLSEYIYIEAHRQAHVMNVISGLQGVWRSKVTLIPVAEMPSTLGRITEAHAVKKGSWGRFRHGLHKGDLCKIVDIDDSKECFVVEVIPRVDFQKLFDSRSASGNNESGFRVSRVKARTKSLQHFFGEDEFQKTHYFGEDTSKEPIRFRSIKAMQEAQEKIENSDHRLTEIKVLGKRFAFSGHEIKTVRQSAVTTDRRLVNITTDEHIRFERGRIPTTAREIKRLREIRETDLSVGDKVVVSKGELRGTNGVVREIMEDATGTKYHVKLDNELLPKPVPLPKSELSKVIDSGSHVKINSGTNKGETGMVVQVDGDRVRIFSSKLMEEFEVFMSDVVETKELSTTCPLYGDFEVYELVKLRGTTTGMIVKIENGMFSLLTNLGKQVTVHYAEIKEVVASTRQSNTRKGRRQTGIDKYGNEVMQDDFVRIVSDKSLWEGKSALVMHVFHDTLWLSCPEVRENMGFFVMPRNDVWLIGGDRKLPEVGMEAYPLPSSEVFEQAAEIEGETNIRKKRKKERDASTLIGRRVRIVKGYHKGFLGIVNAVHGDQIRVEMHTGELNLTVQVDMIKEVGINDSLATLEQKGERARLEKRQKAGPTGEVQKEDVMQVDSFSDAGTSLPDWSSNLSDMKSLAMSGSVSGGSRHSQARSRVLATSAASSRGSSVGSAASSRRRPTRSHGQHSVAGTKLSEGALSGASLGGSRVLSAANLAASQMPVPEFEPLHKEYPWWAIRNAVAMWADPNSNRPVRVKIVRATESPLSIVIQPIDKTFEKGFGQRKVSLGLLSKAEPEVHGIAVALNRDGYPAVESSKGMCMFTDGATATIEVSDIPQDFSKEQVVEVMPA